MNKRSITGFMSIVIAAILVGAGLFSFGFGSSVPAGEATTKPLLHPLFSDHMVLQRDMATSVWGWTQPGQEVKVTLADKTATAVADAAGKWLVKLDSLPAGGPHTLTVAGPQTVEIKDVLVGDVWICSGQSNMTSSTSPGIVYGTRPASPRLRSRPRSGDESFERRLPSFSSDGQHHLSQQLSPGPLRSQTRLPGRL